MTGRLRAILLVLVYLYTLLLFPDNPLFAQEIPLPPSIDIVPPAIQHEPGRQPVVERKPLMIEAIITDNASVKVALLFYRVKGSPQYQSVQMETSGNGLYTATIPGSDVLEPGIEYYIEASDPSGNIAQKGLATSPLVVAVGPSHFIGEPDHAQEGDLSRVQRLAQSDRQSKPAWYKKWWVWSLMGAVALGGIVAVAAGGGKGNNAPTPGSANIRAPIP